MKALLSALSVGLALMVTATSASAVPFSYRFESSVDAGTTGLPASPGDPVSITVTLDNGGTSDLSQVWTAAHLQSVVFDINNGAATASFFSPFDGGLTNTSGSFATNALGNLISAPSNWLDFGVSADLALSVPFVTEIFWAINGFNSVLGDNGSLRLALADVVGTTDPGNWSRVTEATPLSLPPTLMLLLVGLAGVALLRRGGPGTAGGFAAARVA